MSNGDEYSSQESSSKEIVLVWLKMILCVLRDASAGKTLEDQSSGPQNHGKPSGHHGPAVSSE